MPWCPVNGTWFSSVLDPPWKTHGPWQCGKSGGCKKKRQRVSMRLDHWKVLTTLRVCGTEDSWRIRESQDLRNPSFCSDDRKKLRPTDTEEIIADCWTNCVKLSRRRSLLAKIHCRAPCVVATQHISSPFLWSRVLIEIGKWLRWISFSYPSPSSGRSVACSIA